MKSETIKTAARVPFDYVTVRAARSRIGRGILVIPVSLMHLFPSVPTEIVLVNGEGVEEAKTFRPNTDSGRECRILGLRKFYIDNKVADGDEVVVQMLGRGRYRITSEAVFERNVLQLEQQIEVSDDEKETDALLNRLSQVTNVSVGEVANNEFVRLATTDWDVRKTRVIARARTKEGVPAALRRILFELYHGKCQLTGFTFLTKAGIPYFEIHHINSSMGNHVKNLLVVCPNAHAQFTHARLEQHFDSEGWLRRVEFNSEPYLVFQAVDRLGRAFEKSLHF